MYDKTTIKQYIKEHGEIIIAPMGNSMLPLLKEDRCQVILKEPEFLPKRFDVVLYQAKSGKQILHRIVQVHPASFTICGDNTYVLEKEIKREQILAVMTGFYRKDKYISCTSLPYCFYVKIWWILYPLRKVMFSIVKKGYRILRRRNND